VSKTADWPGQAVNVDLLFVPLTHEADIKLPAVSGSSGHLVIERLPEAGPEPSYPGQVFANPGLSYAEAMRLFVEASAPISGPRQTAQGPGKSSRCEQGRQLRQEQADLRAKRQPVRQKRQTEDADWRKNRQELCQNQATGKPKVRARWGSGKRKARQRQTLRDQRQQQLALRQKEDEQWRLDRHELREKMELRPLVSAWIAVLLVTDNCSRQCLGLPLFIAGAHVTAEMMVTALKTVLPAELQLLIADRGIHFTAQVFQQCAREANFVHVVIARHRPQSNGIAERFVRTIKEWLADKTWTSDKELEGLLATFLSEFNDRPHQGLPIPGLSPKEYANRLWLM
jgi:transposase InsO family protein